jgi:hypothetical protein
MTFGVDYTGPASPATLAKLVGQNVKFVCRYVAPIDAIFNWKRVTADEVAAVKAAGLDVVLVFESSAQRALGGGGAGFTDAQVAYLAAIDVGLSGAPIYFAVDFDIIDYAPTLANTPENARAKLGPVAAYFDSARTAIGRSRVGAYGGYWAIKRLFDAGLIAYGWQTYAWSGGQWDSRAHIRQYKNGQTLAGISVDFNNAMFDDFGQWKAPIPKPAPVLPKPDPKVLKRAALRAWVLLNRRRGATWAWIKSTGNYRLWRRLGGR